MQLLSIDLVLASAAGEIVFPRFTGEQNPDTTVRIDAEDCDVAILIEAEGHPDALAAGIDGSLAAVRGQLDSGSVKRRVPVRWRRNKGQAE
jgi:hypothetical protein